jgi:pilus assembly protein CpaB
MKRNRLGIIAAVVIAAIATVVLVVYVRDAKESAVAGEKLVDVVVASEAIKAGTAATDLRNATTMERIPAKTRPDGALQSLKQVEGLVTSTDLVASEVLLQDRFVSPGQVEKGVASGERRRRAGQAG